MHSTILLCISVYIGFIGFANGGNSVLLPMDNDNRNQTSDDRLVFNSDKILKRDKRYLLWTGGGISKV